MTILITIMMLMMKSENLWQPSPQKHRSRLLTLWEHPAYNIIAIPVSQIKSGSPFQTHAPVFQLLGWYRTSIYPSQSVWYDSFQISLSNYRAAWWWSRWSEWFTRAILVFTCLEQQIWDCYIAATRGRSAWSWLCSGRINCGGSTAWPGGGEANNNFIRASLAFLPGI